MSLTTRLRVGTGAAILAVFAAMMTLTIAIPAQAHDQIVSASPAEGESLDVAPTEVTIEFTDEPDPIAGGTVLNVTDETGADVTDGEITIDRRTVSRALQPNLPNGQYTVVWRVVSGDGHPITDSYQFAIGEPVATVTEDASNSTEPKTVTATDASATPLDWGRVASLALLGAFGGVALYVAILALIRRTKRRSE